MTVVLQAEAQVIADNMWHLHDTVTLKELHMVACMEYINPTFAKVPKFKSAPTKPSVGRVLKRFFPFVKQFRDGEYGQCGICKEHSDTAKIGFVSEEAKAAYETDRRIHSKIHRINRYAESVREAIAMKSPHVYSLHRFDWTRPFKVPWSRRCLDDLKNRQCIQITCWH